MKKRTESLVAAALLGTLGALAGQNHVPSALPADVPAFDPRAAARNHVLLVNVDAALPASDWGLVSTYAASRIPVCIWTNALAAVDTAALLERPDRLRAAVKDPRALVAVFVCNRPAGAPPVVAVPGHFACVNLGFARTDRPAPALFRDRAAKLLLKGIAAACGSGATIEPLCSLFYGTRTLEGLDKTNITISPMAYFPMVETLRALGGDEAISVPTADAE